jgi:hypothetical protein
MTVSKNLLVPPSLPLIREGDGRRRSHEISEERKRVPLTDNISWRKIRLSEKKTMKSTFYIR